MKTIEYGRRDHRNCDLHRCPMSRQICGLRTSARVGRCAPDLVCIEQSIIVRKSSCFMNCWRSLLMISTREGLTTATQRMVTMTVPPNSATYVELFFGWSASGFREAGYRAQQLLQDLEDMPATLSPLSVSQMPIPRRVYPMQNSGATLYYIEWRCFIRLESKS